MRSLGRILADAKSLWPYYLGVTAASLAAAGLALVTPFLVRRVTDIIVAALSQPDSTEAKQAVATVTILAIALLVSDLASTLFRNLGGYVGDVLAAKMRELLSTRYYAKLLSLPQAYFDTQRTGTVIARLDRSITSITNFLQGFANNFFSMLLTLIAVLAITAFFYWPIAVLLVIVFPIYLWLTMITSKRWQKIEGEKNSHIDQASGRFAEVVGQPKIVKSYVTEIRELKLFAEHFKQTITLTKGQSRWWHLMDVVRGVAMGLVFFGIYIMLFYRTLDGSFSIGTMVLMIQLVTMARQPIYLMSYLVDNAQRAIAGSKDYFSVMDETPEPSANPQLLEAATAQTLPALEDRIAQPLSPDAEALTLTNVSFHYPDDDSVEVLHDISFAAQRGQKIALVSESGGGKSTLVNLILGLYEPSAGSIVVAGKDTKELTTDQLRASVGVVFQEASLFSGTVRENIAYANPEVPIAEVIAAAKKANAHEFIMGFPDGYDTVLGERGLRLSGGQRQRISIARALLKDSPILVLDEATSALDNRSEQAVQQGLDELMANRTSLIIAHRLSTIEQVDTIITLKDGAIDEIGSPAELAHSGGIYSQLLSTTDREDLKCYGLRWDHLEASAH